MHAIGQDETKRISELSGFPEIKKRAKNTVLSKGGISSIGLHQALQDKVEMRLII